MALLDRRLFLGALASAALAAESRVPTHKAKPVRLFKSPDGHPNALEATPEGLWVGEQVTDRAYLLDWKTGAVLKKVDTESSNTSGIAYGGGYLWMAANGAALGRLLHPHELKTGRIVQVDPETGRTVKVHPTLDGGGCHGLVFADGSLWMTCFKWNVIARVNPKTFELQGKFPLQHTRPHGLAWDSDGMWVGYSNDFVFLKQDVKDGHVLEAVTIEKGGELDPHGMDIYQGTMYVTDAGISPGGVESESPGTGYIYRLERIT
jgi:streptogramin lyase